MRKIVDRLISILCIVLIVFSLILVVASIILKSSDKIVFVGNYSVVKITTESMAPTLPVGTYILLEKADTESLKKGDIITFYSEDPTIYGSLNTHRINQIKNGEFVTKGDNNLVADAYTVKPESVAGKYHSTMTFFGSMMGIISNPFAYFVLIFMPILILVIISVKDVITATKQKQESDDITQALEQMKENGELDKYLESSTNLDKDLVVDEDKSDKEEEKS